MRSLNELEERHYQLQALRADTTGFMVVDALVTSSRSRRRWTISGENWQLG